MRGPVQKAIVLAAGLGTRLRPLTNATPKPLLPVWGEPMLARLVARLRAAGVTDIVVNCHYLHEQVEAWCAANGCRASRESEILGTGGVLNPLRGWIGQDDFYLVNGDIVVEGLDALDALAPARPDEIAAALVTAEGPRTIEVEPASRYVTCWKSPDPGCEGTFTYCGFARLSAAILDYVPPSGFSTIVQAYEKAMAAGRFVRAVAPEGLLWTDAGTIPAYIDLNRTEGENAFAAFPFLARVLPSPETPVEFLGARGSDRVFFKLGNDRVAIVYDDAKRPENARYAAHARGLAAFGLPVPEVLAEDAAAKTLVLSWGGVDRQMTLDEYAQVVGLLAKFHAVDPARFDLEPPFDAKLWQWERELFFEHALGTRYRMACPAAVKAELESVAARLAAEPVALVHRDFQSTNVLWRGIGAAAAPTLIDFQGMRRGPAAYDLASLVYDPYVSLTDTARRALVALYAKASGRADIGGVLPFAAVQRLVQCLGAYGRLASVGQTGFTKFILPALENLLAAADEANLDALGALAEDLLAREHPAKGPHADGCACGCGHDRAHES